MEAEANKTYKIPEPRLAKLTSEIEKLNKRARKLGVPEVVMTVGDAFEEEDSREKGCMRRYFPVTVEGKTPKLDGWTFAAKLMHVDGVTLLAAVPGMTVPEKFRDASPDNCDHCQKVRRRNDTFVVRNGTDDSWKQVGRSCLADFLGGKDPAGVASWCELLIRLDELAEAEESWGGWGGGWYRFELVDVLSRTAVAVRECGWMSRTAARNSFEPVPPPATADTVLSDYTALHPDYRDVLRKMVTEADQAEAEAALEWAAGLETSGETLNDYLWNVTKVAQMGSVDSRLFGVACSILVAYRKKMEREIERKRARETSKHFGEVGKRGTYELTLLGSTSTEGYYGTTFIFRFMDAEGNRATWFASRSQDLTVGETYKMKATVKKHESYKGVAQTVLTRCTVVK